MTARPPRPARCAARRAGWLVLAALAACSAPPPADGAGPGGTAPAGGAVADLPAPLAGAEAERALAEVGFSLDWLDWLSEDVVRGGDTLRFVWIYAEPVGRGGAGRPDEPPDPAHPYAHVGDDDEGIACVDDAARAAVLHLRHYEATGSARSRRSAVKLLRFVRALQAESGLFYNFVWDRSLRVNTEHPNSVADEVSWWTARAVWALGEGARVLAESDPAEAGAALDAVRRVEPHLDRLLARYPETADEGGRRFPQWLLYGTASDATSELLLGLAAVERAAPSAAGARRLRRFAEGVAGLRFGSLRASPYGGHASWAGGWHGWGNSQSQALAGAARWGLAGPDALASAQAEARTLYARLLVEGWLHAVDYETGEERRFEQIAYDVRPVAVGLVRLYEATGEARYAVQAGLAASWLRGANPAGATMADPATGRGYDGVLGPDRVNWNAGAESTVEAQMTLLEVALHPAAARWLGARPAPPATVRHDGRTLRARAFTGGRGGAAVVALDVAADSSAVWTGADAERILDAAGGPR